MLEKIIAGRLWLMKAFYQRVRTILAAEEMHSENKCILGIHSLRRSGKQLKAWPSVCLPRVHVGAVHYGPIKKTIRSSVE